MNTPISILSDLREDISGFKLVCSYHPDTPNISYNDAIKWALFAIDNAIEREMRKNNNVHM